MKNKIIIGILIGIFLFMIYSYIDAYSRFLATDKRLNDLINQNISLGVYQRIPVEAPKFENSINAKLIQ